MAILPLFLGSLLLTSVNGAPQQATPISDYRLPTPASSSRAVSSTSSTPSSSLTGEERDDLFRLHEELVNIPSISSQEKECADFISEYLKELDYHVEKVPVNTSTGYNVFAYPKELREQGVWPEVLITSHIDTVPPFYGFERREQIGKIYHFGRGTVDAKGPVATMIIAAHKFFQSRSDNPRLGMLFVVEEETGGAGMKAFANYARNTTFRAGIFGEPTEGKLASGHKGTLSLMLDIKGKSAHSAYPWLGVSAINYLANAIVTLNALEPALPRSDLLGASTLNAGIIRGGVAGNVVPEAANASVTIRIARSESGAVGVVRDMITGMLRPLKDQAEEANGTFTMTFAEGSSPALILDTDVNGLEVAPVFYGTDIPRLPQVGKKYLYGTGSITVAHTPNEQLSQDELVQAAVAYGLILEHLFSNSTNATSA